MVVANTRAGLEAAAIAAHDQTLLRAGQRRYCRRRRVSGRRPQEHRLAGAAGESPQSLISPWLVPNRLSPWASLDEFQRRGWLHLRPNWARGKASAGVQQELRQGVHAAPSHPDCEVLGLLHQRAGARGVEAVSRSHRGQGRWAGRGQRCSHRAVEGRSPAHGRGNAGRQVAGRGRFARGAGRMSQGRRIVLPGDERRRSTRGAAGRGSGSQAGRSSTTIRAQTPAAWARIRPTTSSTSKCATGW